MPSFEELQNKSVLSALGLKSLLEKTAQTAESIGSGLAGISQRGVQQFKQADPYTRAELGGLAGQVIGEVITGREAPRTAEAIRQVPTALRERKEKQEEKQLEKLKLLRDTQQKNSATETTLRKEFQGVTKDFREVRNAYDRVLRSAEDPSAAGDLALIFNYMKILDPGSVVREGEFATAANSGSIPSRITAQYNKILEGERLDSKMRDDFVTKAKSLYDGRKGTYKKESESFIDLSKRYGLNPENVVLDYFLDEREVTKTQEENKSSGYSNNYNSSLGNINYRIVEGVR